MCGVRYLGIDPGLSGGIAYVDDDGHANAWPMPATEREILDLLEWLTVPLHTTATLERVGATPQMGVVSAFTFGKGYGGLLMALTAAGIPFDQVAPVKWQNVMEVRTPKERRVELGHKDKNITKRRAEQLFPKIKVTHAIADALLLASYARRTARLPFDSASGDPHGKEARHRHQAQARGQAGEEVRTTRAGA